MKTQLTKRTFLLWAGLTLAAVGSYLFYFIMARMLSIEDYGLLYSLIALTYLFTVPHETIRTVMAKYTAHFWVKEQKGKIKGLMFRSIKFIFIFSVIIFIVFLILLPLWTKIWHTNIWPLFIIGLSLLVTFMLPVIWGILQGTNRFGHLGLNNSVEMILKLVVAIILVGLGFGVNGALIAIPLSIVFAFFAGFIPIKDITKARKESFTKKSEKQIIRYSISAFVIFMFFIALYSVDIILARYFFSALDAGLYSAISVIGKVVIFSSVAITRVMFSEIVEKYGKEKSKKSRKKSRKILFRALGFLTLLVAFFLFLAFIFPELITTIVVGNRYIDAAPFLKYIVLAMSFLSFSSLIVFYNLSIDYHKKITAKILGAALFLQVALLILFHTNIEEFVKVLLGINIGLFLALLATLKR